MAAERVAIYPGSFDPPTNGHLDIVERAARLFDRVVIGVGLNLSKKAAFTADERVELMRESCTKLANVEVRTFDGLQVRVQCIDSIGVICILHFTIDFTFIFLLVVVLLPQLLHELVLPL